MLGQLGRCCVVGCSAKDLRAEVVSLFPLSSISLDFHFYQCKLKRCSQARIRTGNTTGTPPLTAFVPSVFAFSLTHSFSFPAASFQLMIVAPKSSTSMLSPVGSTAETRLLECEIVTWAWGVRLGVAERAEGFFGRSTMLEVLELELMLGRRWGEKASEVRWE